MKIVIVASSWLFILMSHKILKINSPNSLVQQELFGLSSGRTLCSLWGSNWTWSTTLIYFSLKGRIMVQALVTGPSPRRPGFDPRFLVDTLAVGQIALLALRLPSSLFFHQYSSWYWHYHYQKNKWAKHGNLQAKKCPFGCRWRIGQKVTVTWFCKPSEG